MTEYFFRQLSPDLVEITKVSNLGDQEAVYQVDLVKEHCTCLANARGVLPPNHKHFVWARDWQVRSAAQPEALIFLNSLGQMETTHP